MQDDGTAFEGVRLQRPLWPHQQRALAALDQSRAAGSASTYLVIPPGGGKTLVGLEAARRLARPTLVLCPNTAIQAQWIAQWDSAFTPAGAMQATASRDLPTPLTVLTYQAVCTIGNGSASTGRQASGKQLLEMVHPNGQALLSRLSARGPWTLVLDECHHLLEIWGRLLAVIVESLAGAHVIGLTATPPHMMTSDQKALHDELFGAIDLEVSAPALVRDGRLAPYQELAYFTTPTRPEADYIHGQAVRFAELRAGLLDPGFAATPFLDWLQRRIVDRREDGSGALVSWERFERDEPALAGAALRLHGDGLLPLPEGARLREQHRHPPAAEDWVALIGDYCRHCLLAGGDPRDERAYEAIRAALPSIGYRLTRTGPRTAESPVDRVLARSASKGSAAAEILRAESAELGGRLRALVLTDFIEAGGTVPADLSGVMDEGAGGALLALVTLLADEDGAALDPVLMTGQRVACGTGTARRLADALNASAPGLGATVVPGAVGQAADGQVMDIAGGPGWEPRRYVPLVTRFFADGGSRCLIGTRALLGEGWDAPAVNVVIDLTAATTPTSVVQARGRDALHEAGLASRDGTAIQLEPLPAGGYRARLRDVPAAEAATFAAALDEVLAPLAQPRYIVPRLFLPRPAGRRAAIGLAVRRLAGRGVPATVVYHAVPSVLGVNRKLAQVFTRAWNARVSPGELLYAGSPEGTGILVAQRGDDPFAVTTQIRTLWR